MTAKALLNPARKPAPGQADDAPGLAARASAWRAFLRNPLRPGGHAAAFAAVALSALFAGVLFPGDPLDMVAQPLLGGQDAAFFLGSDSLGRDVAAGLAHGARVSLAVGAAAAGISLGIGVLVGAAAGYFGGWLDDVLVRLTELVQTIPTFLLVIVIVAIGQPSAHDRAGHWRCILAGDRAAGARRVPRCARPSSCRPRAAGASATPGSSSARSCPMPCRRWW